MIGLLITGHGNFATGVTSSVDLIAGKQENYQAIDFLPTYNLDDLDREMKKALDNLKDCSGVLILCDLLGGTPFNKAAELSTQYQNVSVVAGTNLSMLLEVAMTRKFEEDLNALADAAIESGKEQIAKYELLSIDQEEPEDGI